MKNLLVKSIMFILCLSMLNCQKDDDNLSEELILENQETQGSIEKNGDDLIIICSSQGIPDNFVIESYLNVNGCPNENLFLGRYNAALGRRISPRTPNIYRAGAGCNDNYCIWIVGENFEPNAYIDIRTTTGQSIIGTYRGADRQINISPNGDDTMSIRLRTPFERNEFARNGLRIWVVNPVARTWGDGRTVRRPRDIVDPPCNPICP